MRRLNLPLGGIIAILAFVVSACAGAFWFDANAAQAGTPGIVDVQAVIAEKTTVHRPVSATTNGQTVRRLENSFLVTLAFVDGRDPPLTIEQHVTGDFFYDVDVQSPVRVTVDTANARIVNLTPGLIPDPTRFLATSTLGLIFIGLGIGAVIWRRKTFDGPMA